MKPQMVMLEVRPLDARKLPVTKEPYKFPYIELENLVFLRVPDAKMKSWKLTGEMDHIRDVIMNAAAQSGTSYVTVPDTVAMLDRVMQDIQEMEPEKLTQEEVMVRLATFRDEILTNNHPTNKTFILLPETVRFLEVKEKWETIKDQPQQPKKSQ